jgi:hypothetical protein
VIECVRESARDKEITMVLVVEGSSNKECASNSFSLCSGEFESDRTVGGEDNTGLSTSS